MEIIESITSATGKTSVGGSFGPSVGDRTLLTQVLKNSIVHIQGNNMMRVSVFPHKIKILIQALKASNYWRQGQEK